MPRWLYVTLCLIVVVPASAEAQVRAGEIATASEGTEAWTYLRGLKEGIEWAVSGSRFDKEQPPFCPPPNLAITAAQYRQILNDQIRRHPEQARHFAGLVMMDALKRTFPCPSKP